MMPPSRGLSGSINHTMLPVRCFTCNKVIGRYESEFASFKKTPTKLGVEDLSYTDFFTEFGITRYCCRKIFLTHVDIYQHDAEIEMEHVKVYKDLEVQKIVTSD